MPEYQLKFLRAGREVVTQTVNTNNKDEARIIGRRREELSSNYEFLGFKKKPFFYFLTKHFQ